MYREVCSTCHSIKFVAFRNLIGVSHSEAEVRTGVSVVFEHEFCFACASYVGRGDFGAAKEQRGHEATLCSCLAVVCGVSRFPFPAEVNAFPPFFSVAVLGGMWLFSTKYVSVRAPPLSGLVICCCCRRRPRRLCTRYIVLSVSPSCIPQHDRAHERGPQQVKKIAAEFEVEEGPNDEGEMFERPAKPSDR